MCVFDLLFVISAVLFNLLITVIFIAQKRENDKLTRVRGRKSDQKADPGNLLGQVIKGLGSGGI